MTDGATNTGDCSRGLLQRVATGFLRYAFCGAEDWPAGVEAIRILCINPGECGWSRTDYGARGLCERYFPRGRRGSVGTALRWIRTAVGRKEAEAAPR